MEFPSPPRHAPQAAASIASSDVFADAALDTKRWRKLAAYQERLFARPSFQKALALG